MKAYYAHSSGTGADRRLHLLDEHLHGVAALARRFAIAFGPQMGHLAGLWHDLGKYRRKFQEGRLGITADENAHVETNGERLSHSHAGALHALGSPATMGVGKVLAYLIAGHHTGLPDWHPADGDSAESCLKHRLASKRAQDEYRDAMAEAIPADVLQPDIDPKSLVPSLARGEALPYWIRMLFSALVDADFLDTEAFFDADKASKRVSSISLLDVDAALDNYLSKFDSVVDTQVNRQRRSVLSECRAASAKPPGFFTLTVPTGGGKTLSSLSFALKHALAHNKRRVIYAIPYTSIIEQTASEFKKALGQLGNDVVLEHHSNLDTTPGDEDAQSRLAAENWDTLLVVTTTVQLFESLFAARTSRCRKLHNIANSVIVLDEAQLLSPTFLAPITQALRVLVRNFGVSVLLCTATQPELRTRRHSVTGRLLLDGIDDASEIAGDGARIDHLFASLKRVRFEGLSTITTRREWAEVADQISQERCALAIVNTRGDAANLHALVKQRTDRAEVLHLSATMCGQHRKEVLDRIKARLTEVRTNAASHGLIVIATQLIEAGVDVDFPVVYRALAGLDSIAQAAGRCNREGRIELGRVVVFNPPQFIGHIKQAVHATLDVLRDRSGSDLGPTDFVSYFDRYYARFDSLDERKIIQQMKNNEHALEFPFRTVAEQFHLIDDDTQAVVVSFVPSSSDASPVLPIIQKIKAEPRNRGLYRALQRYTVNVRRKEFERMVAGGDVVQDGPIWTCLPIRYDSMLGLLPMGSSGEFLEV